MPQIAMNYIEKTEITHGPDDDGDMCLDVLLTPHEGEKVGIRIAVGCLTAVELARQLRGLATAIESWGERAGITNDTAAAMVARGDLPSEALEGRGS